MITYTADNGSYIKNILTVHATTSAPGTPARKVKTVCGQMKKTDHFFVHSVPQEVNCKKCLGI